MRIRQRDRRRPRTTVGFKRQLVLETLETRQMLASLTSRLPAITISVGTEPVQIRPLADPTQETSLPTAAVSALRELAFLEDLFADTNRRPDDGFLGSLQHETWLPFADDFENDVFDAIPVKEAVEIANTGFEVVRPPLEDVIAQIFGPPLSVTPPIERHENTPQVNRSDPQNSGIDPLDATIRLSEIPSKHGTDELVKAPVDSEQKEEVTRESEAARITDRDQKKTSKVEDPVAIQPESLITEPAVADRDDHGVSRVAAGMILLQQPVTEADQQTSDTAERLNVDSQSEMMTQYSLVTNIDEKLLKQMQLLPMAPITGGEGEMGPKMIAGFNPVAMLQIFLGGDLGSGPEVSEAADLASENSRSAHAATEPLFCLDHLTTTAFVLVVGYWYFHTGIDRRLLRSRLFQAFDFRRKRNRGNRMN